MICETCQSEHTGLYGSGRFCNSVCARTYASRLDRKEKNEKIRQKLTLPPHEKMCPQCKNSFLTKNKHKTFCCRSCSSTHTNSNPELKENRRISRLREIEKGNIGYGIKCSYEGIRCDSALEYAFVKWFLSKNPDAKIERFKGYLQLSESKYQPDFLVDGDTIVEVKYTSPYVGEKLSKKWKTYLASQEEKKQALVQSGYKFLWITEQDIGSKFYRECLIEVKTNPGFKSQRTH